MAVWDRDYMREQEPSWGGLPGRRWYSSATLVLMAVIATAFILQTGAEFFVQHNAEPDARYHAAAVQVANVLGNLPLSTEGLRHGYVWQLISFQFLHAGFWHLFFNLIVIWSFGRVIEGTLGNANLLKLYFLSGTVGGLVQGLLGFVSARYGMPVVGASAGAMGLVAAFAMIHPDEKIWLYMILPISARQVLWISFVIAVFFIAFPMNSNMAHGAHLGGLLTGVAYIYWRLYARNFPGWLPARSTRPRPAQLVRTYSFKQDFLPHRPNSAPEELPPDEFISREVDPILDKISSQGIHSLTDRERKVLDAARRKMEKR